MRAEIHDHRRYVQRVCMRYVGPTLAEDMVQETFRKATEKLDTFEGRAQLRTWLTTIALNVCRCHMRVRQNQTDKSYQPTRTQVDGTIIPLEIEDAKPSALDMIILREDSDRIRKLVHTLPGCYQAVIISRYLEERTIAQTAEVLGCTIGAVKAMQNRGLRMLREKLAHA